MEDELKDVVKSIRDKRIETCRYLVNYFLNRLNFGIYDNDSRVLKSIAKEDSKKTNKKTISIEPGGFHFNQRKGLILLM